MPETVTHTSNEMNSIRARSPELHRPRAGYAGSKSSDRIGCKIHRFCQGELGTLVISEMNEWLINSFLQVGIGESIVDEAGKPMLDGKDHYKVAEEMYPVGCSRAVASIARLIYLLIKCTEDSTGDTQTDRWNDDEGPRSTWRSGIMTVLVVLFESRFGCH